MADGVSAQFDFKFFIKPIALQATINKVKFVS